jgi:hypothetical protein
MLTNGSQVTPAGRIAAIEFMIGHLYWMAHNQSTPETIAESQQQLRDTFAGVLRVDSSRSVPAAEGLEALENLLGIVAATKP